MDCDEKRRVVFPLRLAVSLRELANVFAHRDGISLNHFVSLAVAEKISRMEHEPLLEHAAIAKQQRLNGAAGLLQKSLF